MASPLSLLPTICECVRNKTRETSQNSTFLFDVIRSDVITMVQLREYVMHLANIALQCFTEFVKCSNSILQTGQRYYILTSGQLIFLLLLVDIHLRHLMVVPLGESQAQATGQQSVLDLRKS